MAYSGTHQDINLLMLYPWPNGLRLSVHAGQIGRLEDLTWQQYLALVGEHWEMHGRYPRHQVSIHSTYVSVAELTAWGQLWGLAVRALLERGYMDMSGNLYPPIPFSPPPPENFT